MKWCLNGINKEANSPLVLRMWVLNSEDLCTLRPTETVDILQKNIFQWIIFIENFILILI